MQNLNTTQFWMVDEAYLRSGYKKGHLTATGYVYGILKVSRKDGWWYSLNITEFCLKHQITRTSLYRALKKLQEDPEVNLQWSTTQVKIMIPARDTHVPNSDTPNLENSVPNLANDVPNLASQIPNLASTVSNLANEMAETSTQQATQESPISSSDNLRYTDSSIPPTDNAQADASPLPHPLGRGEEEDEDFWDLDKEEEEVDYFPSTDDSYVMPEEFQPILEESGYSTVRELLTYQIYWFTDTVHLKTDEKLAMNFDFHETWKTIAPRINKYIDAGAQFHEYVWWWINEFCDNDDYSCEIGRHFIRQFKDLNEMLESRIGVIILCDCLHHFDELAVSANNVA